MKSSIQRILILCLIFIEVAYFQMSLGFKFLGQCYFIVYVGAIGVLFIFIVKQMNK